MKLSDIQSGVKVRFAARGKRLTGVVLRRRVRRRKGRARALALHVTGNAASLDQEVVEITADDGRVWTVGLAAVEEVLGAADREERQAAARRKSEIKASHARHNHAVRTENFDKVEERGLDSLRPGDMVEIQYRGGYWRKHRFAGMTGSGKVRFEDGAEPVDDLMTALGRRPKARVRFAWPQHARVPKN